MTERQEVREALGLALLEEQPLLALNATDFWKVCLTHENPVMHVSRTTAWTLLKKLKPKLEVPYQFDPTIVKGFMSDKLMKRLVAEEETTGIVALSKRLAELHGLDEVSDGSEGPSIEVRDSLVNFVDQTQAPAYEPSENQKEVDRLIKEKTDG